jgi:hypothetical protein
MSIMPDAKLIEKVPSELANFLVGPLSLDLQRNKTLLHFSRLKRSMLPPVVIVHNYFRCDKLLRHMVTL